MTEMVFTLKRANIRAARLFEVLVRIILSLLLLLMIGIMGRGVLAVGKHLIAFTGDLHGHLKVFIVEALTLLAVLEVYKTTHTYFTLGRVKVTYALDSVLVVLLTEAMVPWFGEASPGRLLWVVGLILLLVVARILAIRYSPGAGTASRGAD